MRRYEKFIISSVFVISISFMGFAYVKDENASPLSEGQQAHFCLVFPENGYAPSEQETPVPYKALFDTASKEAEIPVEVLQAIAYAESRFNPDLISKARKDKSRDMGMFQFNSKYLSWFAEKHNGGRHFDPMLPAEAARIAARHIRWLYDKFEYWPAVILAYNAGFKAVSENRIPETSWKYLQAVYGNTGSLAAAFESWRFLSKQQTGAAAVCTSEAR
jgi:soluble lytic murein transglycosylase-like protein